MSDCTICYTTAVYFWRNNRSYISKDITPGIGQYCICSSTRQHGRHPYISFGNSPINMNACGRICKKAILREPVSYHSARLLTGITRVPPSGGPRGAKDVKTSHAVQMHLDHLARSRTSVTQPTVKRQDMNSVADGATVAGRHWAEGQTRVHSLAGDSANEVLW